MEAPSAEVAVHSTSSNASGAQKEEGAELPKKPDDLVRMAPSNINLGSLLRLFKSEFFDSWILVSYLYRYQAPGVHDYLCNQLYSTSDADVEFYLPQLTNLLCNCRFPTRSLERFMLDKCAKSMHLALKFSCFLTAYIEDGDPWNCEYATQLREAAEESIVNLQRRPVAGKLETSPACSADEDTIRLALEKVRRSEYFQDVHMLLMRICEMSDALRSIAISERRNRLISALQKLSSWMNDKGLYVPLWTADSSHHRIVHIPVTEVILLHSKDRVPFMLFYEVLESSVTASSTPNLHQSSDSFQRDIDRLVERMQEEDSRQQGEDESELNGNENVIERDGEGGQPQQQQKEQQEEEEERKEEEEEQDEAVVAVGVETEEIAVVTEEASDSLNAAALQRRDAEVEEQEELRVEAIASGEKEGVAEDEATESGDNKASKLPGALKDLMLENAAINRRNSLSMSRDDLRAIESEDAKTKDETWDGRVARVRAHSPCGEDECWALKSVVVKFGDDCRQEQLAVQLIKQMSNIFSKAGLPLWVYAPHILVVSSEAAIIETIPNVQSVHQIKKNNPDAYTLPQYFRKVYGDENSMEYSLAQRAFVESLAAYSIVCYILQVKDRHNGNILLDRDGHLIHIDFGFMLGTSPGGLNFESAPWKFTQEYLDLLGGLNGDGFHYYKALLVKGFLALQKYSEKVVVLVEMLVAGRGKGKARQTMSCLEGGDSVVRHLRNRFAALGKTEEQTMAAVNRMVTQSIGNSSTKWYDKFQSYSNGYKC